jgi:chlorite dismutase
MSSQQEREPQQPPPEVPPLDLSEKGTRDGQPISLDRRLFMKFTAIGGCADPHAAIQALEAAGLEGVLYLDAQDPQGIGLVCMSEDPDVFVTALRALLNAPPFSAYTHKPEFDMLGRTYSIGYEPDLVDSLLTKPRTKMTNRDFKWAVWYPLQRAKIFQTLPAAKQRQILAEHGNLAKRYGTAGLAADIRIACHGLDKNDNDFVIGLLGPELYPLSAVVQEMRKTEQTSQYLDSLGPFFVGKVAWQSPQPQAPARG